jgi:hypothetical protein
VPGDYEKRQLFRNPERLKAHQMLAAVKRRAAKNASAQKRRRPNKSRKRA